MWKEEHICAERASERLGKQDYEIVIITDTNEKLIAPQLTAQTVFLEAKSRGQHAASVMLRDIFWSIKWSYFSNSEKESPAHDKMIAVSDIIKTSEGLCEIKDKALAPG